MKLVMGNRNIFIVVEELNSNAYGVNTYVKQIINGFNLNFSRNPITIVEIASENNEVVYIKEGSVLFIKIPKVTNFKGNFDRERFSKHLAFLISTIIRQDEINIFLFNFPQHYFIAKAIQSNLKNIKIIFTIHFLNNLKSLGRNNLIEDSIRNYQKEFPDFENMLQIADKIICLSPYTRDLIQKIFFIPNSKITLIPNGQKDNRQLLSKKGKKEIRKKYNFTDNDKIILYVGRLDETKGLRYLITAFNDLSKNNNLLKLIIVGGGNINEYLKIINSQIMFTGNIEQDVLYSFYCISDLGILPSFAEQCSYSVIEMLMFGLPIMTTTEPNLSAMFPSKNEIFKIKIRKKKNGVLYLSTEEICKNIDVFFKIEKSEINRISNMNRVHFEKHYNIEMMMKKMNHLLELL